MIKYDLYEMMINTVLEGKSMANSILYSEINVVCILILFLLSIRVKKSMFLQDQRQILYLVIISNIIFLLVDALWVFFNNNVLEITITINWILNEVYYILSGILGYLWFCYSETVQKSKLVVENKYKIFAAIPIAALVVLTLLSMKTGWLFYIDAQNVYHRGPAYFMQLLLSYGYVIATAVKAFYLSFHTEIYARKAELRILSTFVIPTLIAGAMQVSFPGYPILCIGNTFGILYVYITLQERQVSIDALTKLNNRNQLFQYLSLKYAHPNENKNMYLLLMDVDYFKSINDQYGHLEGDQALKLLANCLKKVSSEKHYFIARYGGDEFIMVCELGLKENIETICALIHEELRKVNTPYPLSLSIGYSKYEPEMKTHQELIEKADAELYKIKKNRKK